MSALSSLFKQIKPNRPLTCSAIIAAAGTSQRCKGEDKLFSTINGIPAIAYSIGVFEKCEFVRDIVIVSRRERIEDIAEICRKSNFDKVSKVMVGGATRHDSVLNGIYAASPKSELIAIHDAARPCIDIDIVNKAIIAAGKYHAAAPAIAVTSTLKRVSNNIISETIDRDGLFEIQTPQVFRAEIIKAALTNAKKKEFNITDDCMAAEQIGVPVHIVEGSGRNIKITVKEDLDIAELIIKGYDLK